MKMALLTVVIFIMCMRFASSSLHDVQFEGSNIAVDKPAWQSPGTYSDDNTYLKKRFSYDASLAVDGNTDQNFTHGSCTHTTDGKIWKHASWTVDLGAEFHISGIRIYNRLSYSRRRLRNFTIKGDSQLLYDDRSKRQFHQHNISIPLDQTLQGQRYRNITITIPPGPQTILTLCEVQIFGGCKVPPLRNGSYRRGNSTATVDTIVGVGTTIHPECSNGYLDHGDGTLNCNVNSQTADWHQQHPSCEPILCNKLPPVQNGNYAYTSSNGVPRNDENYQTRYGDVATATCKTGYRLGGLESRTCVANNTWNGTAAVCNIVMCEHPGGPQHGYYVTSNGRYYTSGNLKFGTQISLKCVLGYKIAGGNVKLDCDKIGHWTGNKSVCEIVTCEHPGAFENGFYKELGELSEYSRYRFGTTLTVSCNKEYKLASNDVIRTCTERGQWTETTAPMCVLEEKTDGRSYTGLAIGCLISGLIVCLVAIVMLYFHRKGRCC